MRVSGWLLIRSLGETFEVFLATKVLSFGPRHSTWKKEKPKVISAPFSFVLSVFCDDMSPSSIIASSAPLLCLRDKTQLKIKELSPNKQNFGQCKLIQRCSLFFSKSIGLAYKRSLWDLVKKGEDSRVSHSPINRHIKPVPFFLSTQAKEQGDP